MKSKTKAVTTILEQAGKAAYEANRLHDTTPYSDAGNWNGELTSIKKRWMAIAKAAIAAHVTAMYVDTLDLPLMKHR